MKPTIVAVLITLVVVFARTTAYQLSRGGAQGAWLLLFFFAACLLWTATQEDS